jgi:hypothetical protein
MLTVRNLQHYDRVVAFARARGLLPQLFERLWYLHTYAEPDRPAMPATAPSSFDPASWPVVAGRCVVTLSYDGAPASLSVDWSGAVNMFGALIFHGSQEGWHASPHTHVETFAVTLASARELADNPWSIHT